MNSRFRLPGVTFATDVETPAGSDSRVPTVRIVCWSRSRPAGGTYYSELPMSPRFLVINRKQTGRTVLELLRSHFHLTPADVRHLLKVKGIFLGGSVCWDLTHRVRAGQKLRVENTDRPKTSTRPGKNSRSRQPDRTSEKPVPDAVRKTPPDSRTSHDPKHKQSDEQKIHVVHMDKHIVVVEKPAGLTTVRHSSERAEHGARAQRFLPPTLLDMLTAQLSQGRLRAVHRLDKETSGLVIFARTAEGERGFGLQFREHAVQRTYLALVRGRARSETITSHFVRDRGDGRRGSGTEPKGQLASTHVKVLEELGDFTLVECRLETGRTHQVRIHLGERGTPLCGEQIYDRPLNGQPQPDTSGALRPALHAATLAFEHPVTKKQLSFASPLPDDMRKLLKRLRPSTSGLR